MRAQSCSKVSTNAAEMPSPSGERTGAQMSPSAVAISAACGSM